MPNPEREFDHVHWPGPRTDPPEEPAEPWARIGWEERMEKLMEQIQGGWGELMERLAHLRK